jgi:hypothetical protein
VAEGKAGSSGVMDILFGRFALKTCSSMWYILIRSEI